MSTKNPLLCLDSTDKCQVQTKLIKDPEVVKQHQSHDYQEINKIQDRINDPKNKKILDEFLGATNLDSIQAQLQKVRNGMVQEATSDKESLTRINQMFQRIQTELTKNQKEDRRIGIILCSLSPVYDENIFSKIEGDFSFLKEINFNQVLQTNTANQLIRNKKAKSKLNDLETEMQFRQHNALAIQQLDQSLRKAQILPMRDEIKLTQVQLSTQVNKTNNQVQKLVQKIIQWEDDDKKSGCQEQLDVLKDISGFYYHFEVDRKIGIVMLDDYVPGPKKIILRILLMSFFKSFPINYHSAQS